MSTSAGKEWREGRSEDPRHGERAQRRADRDHMGDHVDLDPQSVAERERQWYGGLKIGSAFFGWLAAAGMGVLLTALVAAGGAALGVSTGVNTDEATGALSRDAATVGTVGIIVLAVVVLIAYYCGGYVAGRMARFNGMKQGLAVWLWALVIAIIVAVVVAVGGSQFNVLANLNSFPRIPVNEGTLNTMGIIALVVAAVVALVGALLGGLAGMRFHRRVDRAGLST